MSYFFEHSINLTCDTCGDQESIVITEMSSLVSRARRNGWWLGSNLGRKCYCSKDCWEKANLRPSSRYPQPVYERVEVK